MEKENNLAIKNTFKYYRYEIPNIIVSFGFSDYDRPIRANRDDEGWDELTNIIPMSDLPQTQQLRMKPFLEKVDEQFYLENCNVVDYQDCIVTQDWARKPSDETVLYNMLNETNDNNFPEKITTEFFLSIFFNEKYYDITKDVITFDDVESFDIKFLFLHDVHEDDVEIMVENIVWKDPASIKSVLKDDDPYPNMVYIDESIFKYYFDIDTRGKNVTTLLQQEYLITPAMVLDYELYQVIEDKINAVEYKAVARF